MYSPVFDMRTRFPKQRHDSHVNGPTNTILSLRCPCRAFCILGGPQTFKNPRSLIRVGYARTSPFKSSTVERPVEVISLKNSAAPQKTESRREFCTDSLVLTFLAMYRQCRRYECLLNVAFSVGYISAHGARRQTSYNATEGLI